MKNIKLKNKKTKKEKKITKNSNTKKISKGVMTYISLGIIGVSTILALGYTSNRIPSNVNFVVTDVAVPNMNYITGTGTQTRFLQPVMEGFIGPNTSEVNSPLNNIWYEEVIKDTSVDPNYKSLLEEYNKPLYLEQASIDNHKPSDFVNDCEIDPETKPNCLLIPGFSKRQAKKIVVDSFEATRKVTIYLRDNYYSPTNNWVGRDKIYASDYAFAMKIFLNKANGAANAYQLPKYSNINKVKSCWVGQGGEGVNDPLIPWDDVKDCYEKDIDGALFYNANGNESPFVNNPDSSAGIVYDNTNNVIQFNLEQATPYFHTLFMNNTFWPIHEEWYEDIVGDDFLLFGQNVDLIRTTGPFYPETFDSAYGSYFIKNDKYWAADIVTSNRWFYRVMEETATQTLMFETGYSSYAILNEDASSGILENPNLTKFVQPAVEQHQTRYLIFNLHKEHSGPNVDYIRNPNFRRALSYAVRREEYLNLSGFRSSIASPLFTSKGMSSIPFDQMIDNSVNGGFDESKLSSKSKDLYETYLKGSQPSDSIDFVDFTTLYSFLPYDNADEEIILNPYPVQLRQDSYSMDFESEEFKNLQKDKNTNIEASKYYWDKFLAEENPRLPITLDYISPNSSTDVNYKYLQQVIDTTLHLSGKIRIEPRTLPGNSFWNSYYNPSGFDLVALRWSPDFGDPYAFLSLFGANDSSRQANSNSHWTIINGHLGNYDEGINYYFGNSQTKQADRFLTHSPFDLINGQYEINDTTTVVGIYEVFKQLYGNTITEEDPQMDYGVLHALPQKTKYVVYTMFEAMIMDSSPIITYHSEIATNNASRMFNYLGAAIGYKNYAMAYDCRLTTLNKNKFTCNDMFDFLDRL